MSYWAHVYWVVAGDERYIIGRRFGALGESVDDGGAVGQAAALRRDAFFAFAVAPAL